MPKRSEVWKHFNVGSKNTARCRHCEKILKTLGNTSNLMDHLKVKHPSEIPGTSRESDALQTSNSRGSHGKRKKIDEPCSSSTDNQNNSFQESITEAFTNVSSYKGGSAKHKRITTDILYMMCKDCEPFSFVEREGFKTCRTKNVPHYHLPGRKTFKTLMNEKYKQISTSYKNMLRSASNLTLTTDIWTDTMNTRSYLGVTVHFIQYKYKYN